MGSIYLHSAEDQEATPGAWGRSSEVCRHPLQCRYESSLHSHENKGGTLKKAVKC